MATLMFREGSGSLKPPIKCQWEENNDCWFGQQHSRPLYPSTIHSILDVLGYCLPPIKNSLLMLLVYYQLIEKVFRAGCYTLVKTCELLLMTVSVSDHQCHA
jgi:hypothetical protein